MTAFISLSMKRCRVDETVFSMKRCSTNSLPPPRGLSTSRLGHALGRVSFGQRQQRQPEEGEEVPLFAPGAVLAAREGERCQPLLSTH